MHKEGEGRKLSSLGRIQVEADDARYESHASLVAIYGTLPESGSPIRRRCLRHYIFTTTSTITQPFLIKIKHYI